MNFRLACLLLPCAVFAADPVAIDQHWEAVGWGGGGFFWATVFHPADPNVLYLGGDVAGIYKTTDQARHWQFCNNGLHNYGAYGLAISASSPDTLYAQTLDGLAKTTDGGANWRFLPETGKAKLNLSASRGGSVRAVAIDPTNPDVVYAGGATGRLAKTTDGGQTWQALPYVTSAFPEPPSLASHTKACTGNGFAILTYASETGDWNKNGRIEKTLSYPKGEDWSGYRKLTAHFFVPPGAPKIEAQVVIQTGDDWLWQQSAWVAGQPGQWTETALSFDGLKNLQVVRKAYVVLRAPEHGYQGELFVDSVALHTSPDTAVKPGESLPDGVTPLADWEQDGQTDGWGANRQTTDATFITAIRQSAVPAVVEKGVVASVTVVPQRPQTIYVANAALGLVRSDDGGQTWTHLATAPQGVAGVTISPADPNVVYVAAGQSGVHRSDDRGQTWTPLRNGLDPKAGLREVVIDPRNPQVLHAIASLNWDGTYYRSTDGGAHWQANRMMKRELVGNPTLPAESGGGAYPADQATFSRPTNLAISPANPDLLFCSANWRNIFSADGGTSWEERSHGADITCAHDIQFADGKVYVTAMDEGLLVSDNRGATWRQLCPLKWSDDISGHQWRVRLLPNGGILTTVSPWSGQPNAVMLSTDGGQTFQKQTAGLPDYIPRPNSMWGQGYARALAVDPNHPQVIYLGIDGDAEPAKNLSGGGIFRSTDGGRTWQQLPNQPGSRRMFYGLAVDPTDSKRLFWGAAGQGGGVWRSDDGGGSWSRVFSNESWVFNLEVTPDGTIYAGGNNLWRSTDHGQTWKKITGFANGPQVMGIAVDPADPLRIWISRVTWGEGATGGIYGTADGGQTWTEITGDIGYRKPILLRYDAASGELWAGGVGLFKTRP